MGIGFPLYVDLTDNNCTIFGGGENTVRRVRELRRFGAKVTVISPTLCPPLVELSEKGEIRHIPRKYYRGDCSNAQLCVAATDDVNTNIAIATECKAKGIPVNVTDPAVYGNFRFPRVVIREDVVISVTGDIPSEKLKRLRDRLRDAIPEMLEKIEQEEL